MSASVVTLRDWKTEQLAPLSFLDVAEILRVDASTQTDEANKAERGQFFTSARDARFMTGLFQTISPSLHLLDDGAEIGSLAAAFVEEICKRPRPPHTLEVPV